MNLRFENIGHHYGDTRALANINLVARSGEITCLLGSSGCGKTTLLNLAAGLLDIQSGRIALDDATLAENGNNPPPEDRPVGLVFQSGALFPHMSIKENILFGVAKDDRSAGLAEEWLAMTGLDGMGERFPSSLSGGQQQRVALARAMAPEPAVLLLDEPFASIDVVLRKSLRRECRRLLKARGATAIVVTHDPEEAIDIGDAIAVMEGGEIVQAGTPDALYSHPKTIGVASMFGDSQIVHAVRTEAGLETGFGTWPIAALSGDDANPEQLQLLVRETCLTLESAPDGLRICDIRSLGPLSRITLANEVGEEISLAVENTEGLDVGERFSIRPKDASIIAFPY